MSGVSVQSPKWSVGVVIPAQNECAHIARCIRSVLDSIDECALQHAWIVVVADGCTDETVSIARTELAGRGRIIECAVGSPGSARRIGADDVLANVAVSQLPSLWLANTDADTRVPRDWLKKQLDMADSGATAVAGVVTIDSFGGHDTDGPGFFARHYTVNDDGTHGHVHGANIGVRADVYLDAGGWSDIAVGEDHCLWRRVQQRGWLVKSSSASVVVTSGRLQGRARGGFADALRAHI